MTVIEHTENIIVRMPYSAVCQLLTNNNPYLKPFTLESVDIDEQANDHTVTFFLSRPISD